MTSWILVGYLVGLFVLAIFRDRIEVKRSFRAAWIWFALIPISNFVFTLFRAGNIRDTRALTLIEVWSNGFTYLFLGISIICLVNALVPVEPTKSDMKVEIPR